MKQLVNIDIVLNAQDRHMPAISGNRLCTCGGQQLKIDSHPETAGSAWAHTEDLHHRSITSTTRLWKGYVLHAWLEIPFTGKTTVLLPQALIILLLCMIQLWGSLLDICLRFSLGMIHVVNYTCFLCYNTANTHSLVQHVTHDTLCQEAKFIP